MEKRRLGRTEIEVSVVSMGCWPISGMTSLGVTERDSLATLTAAYESGLRAAVDEERSNEQANEAERCEVETEGGEQTAGIVFALVRQIGVLYERVAPAGALVVGNELVAPVDERALQQPHGRDARVLEWEVDLGWLGSWDGVENLGSLSFDINVGNVVHIKAGERHWHGAKADTTMGHITITMAVSASIR